MVKKIIILSTFLFSAIGILLIADLISLNLSYHKLNQMATTISYYISKDCGINDSIKKYVKNEINAEIYCAMDDCSKIKIGDTYFYVIEKDYRSLFLNSTSKTIKVKHSVVIGLYH